MSARALGSSDTLVSAVVIACSTAYAVVVSTLAVLRYEAFATDFDHGIFSQYVWLLGTLRRPFNTIVLRDLLGDHVEPGLALLAPLGTLGIGAPGLLVVQSLALAAAAPLLYALARTLGARGWIAAVPALLWCASPVVLRPAFHDFHPETLVPMLLVGGVLALVRGRTFLFVATAVLACAMKEDVGLTYAVLGLVLLWEGRRRLGAAVAVAGAAWTSFAVLVVLPAFGNAAEQEFGPRFAGARGDSFGDALRFTVVHPLTAADAALSLEILGIGVMLVATTGGLCLLAPRWLLVAAPAAVLNVLSWYDLQHTIDYHYWIVAAGAVALAGAVGAARVATASRRSATRVAAICGVLLGLLSLYLGNTIVSGIRGGWAGRADRQAILDAIPRNAAVAAPRLALSHLSEREQLFVLPEPFLYVRVGTEWGLPERAAAVTQLDYVVFDPRMGFWGAATDAEIERAIVRAGFREILRRGDTRLYARTESVS